MIKKIFKEFINLIYPPVCPLCGEYVDKEIIFCDRCLSKFKRLTPPFCSICAVPFNSPDIHICEDCLRKRPYFESISAPYIYTEHISSAIHLFKYKGKGSVSKALGRLFGEFAAKWWEKNKGDYQIVPVPLNPKRLRERGFNQSLVLARYVAKVTGLPIDYLSLRRIKETPPQSLLKKDERKRNVKDAFKVEGNKLMDKNVILVDDVATTATTLNECAKALKKGGAKKIICLVLARTDPNHISI